MPNAKAKTRGKSYEGLIKVLVALPPSDDAEVYALFDKQQKDCRITGGVPLTMEDLERVSELLRCPSKVDRLAKSLAALPAYIPEHGNVPYF